MTDKITLPGISDDDNGTLNRLLEELDVKQPRNLLRASYYDGKRAIRQVGTVIPPQYYRLGIVLGWSAKAVDILARRCNLDGFVWPDGDLAGLGLPELMEGNSLRTEINAALIASLQHGPAFLINTRGDTGRGEPESLIHVKDALNATGDWNARRRRLDNLLSVTGRDEDGKPSSLALYLDGRTVVAEKIGATWSVDVSTHPWGVPAEVMAYKPQPRRPFGTSRISRPIMSLHDQALRAVVRLEGHMDIYAIPQLVLLGADESIFKNADGSVKASWQVVLGRVFGVPDDDDAENPRADIKQFPAASPEPHLAQLNALAKMFAREASLP
ncbi:MAG TPA: phage portal protein, partial [Mycobacteriales bacterium]|nr:phage portal protein [Mycobacteriales bacterium]